MRRWCRSRLLGCSTIYVRHDQDEALSLADRIVVLRDGAVRQVGKPERMAGSCPWR
jgi:putative spermidine/putrescine transport system ATP-binding protein